MARDTEIFKLIEEEKQRQINGIELIASENFVSEEVMQAMGSVLTNKYAEGLPGKRYYGGCEVVDKVEQLAIDRLCQLFGATWANVQPHSGAQANAAVFLACLQPGDKILGFDLSHGGHLTHGSPVNFSGKLYQPFFYGVNKETGRVDYDVLEETARREQPKMIICGASAYSRDWDYARIRKVADEIGAIILADISHPAGLIAAKLLDSPLPHCHVVTTTTHKTLRGTRGGVIMMRNDFENPFGITTADRSHPQFRTHGCCKCEWDGAVWPFATAQTLTGMANLLNNYKQDYVADSNYFNLLNTYVESQYYRGRPYIGEYLDEKTGYWLKGDEERIRQGGCEAYVSKPISVPKFIETIKTYLGDV